MAWLLGIFQWNLYEVFRGGIGFRLQKLHFRVMFFKHQRRTRELCYVRAFSNMLWTIGTVWNGVDLKQMENY